MFDFTLTMKNLTFQCTKCKRNIKKINLLLAKEISKRNINDFGALLAFLDRLF